MKTDVHFFLIILFTLKLLNENKPYNKSCKIIRKVLLR